MTVVQNINVPDEPMSGKTSLAHSVQNCIIPDMHPAQSPCASNTKRIDTLKHHKSNPPPSLFFLPLLHDFHTSETLPAHVKAQPDTRIADLSVAIYSHQTSSALQLLKPIMSDYLQPLDQDAWMNDFDWQTLDFEPFDWGCHGCDSLDWASSNAAQERTDHFGYAYDYSPPSALSGGLDQPGLPNKHVIMPLAGYDLVQAQKAQPVLTTLHNNSIQASTSPADHNTRDYVSEQLATNGVGNLDTRRRPSCRAGDPFPRAQSFGLGSDSTVTCAEADVEQLAGSAKRKQSPENKNDHSLPTGLSSQIAGADLSANASLPTTPARRRPKAQTFTCKHPGCAYDKSFPRRYELQRHIAAKHNALKPFRCPVVGCFKGTKPSAFPRSDKLADHLRSIHSLETHIFCPDPKCSWYLLNHDLLAVHISKAHFENYDENTEILRAIYNAASPSYRKCLLWDCRKQMPLEDFLEHTMSHKPDEIESVERDLVSAGYSAVRQALSFSNERTLSDTSSGPQSPIKCFVIACPICMHCNDNHEAFRVHMLDSHLISDDHKIHLQLWRAHVQKASVGDASETFNHMSPWPAANNLLEFQYEPGLETFCPGCKQFINAEPSHHHLSMFHNATELETLKLHRRQILRLYPAFTNWTEVWDDLVHPVRCEPWQKTAMDT